MAKLTEHVMKKNDFIKDKLALWIVVIRQKIRAIQKYNELRLR